MIVLWYHYILYNIYIIIMNKWCMYVLRNTVIKHTIRRKYYFRLRRNFNFDLISSGVGSKVESLVDGVLLLSCLCSPPSSFPLLVVDLGVYVQLTWFVLLKSVVIPFCNNSWPLIEKYLSLIQFFSPQSLLSNSWYQLYRFDAEVLGKEIGNNDKHKVVSGDTLYSISKKYKISVDELKSLNGLDSNNLFVGQVIFVKPLPKDF